MLVAAEASGDALGAGLAGALKARLGADVVFVGVGGPRMAELGGESPFDIAELSIHGWLEGFKAYGLVKRRVADGADGARFAAAIVRRLEAPEQLLLGW